MTAGPVLRRRAELIAGTAGLSITGSAGRSVKRGDGPTPGFASSTQPWWAIAPRYPSRRRRLRPALIGSRVGRALLRRGLVDLPHPPTPHQPAGLGRSGRDREGKFSARAPIFRPLARADAFRRNSTQGIDLRSCSVRCRALTPAVCRDAREGRLSRQASAHDWAGLADRACLMPRASRDRRSAITTTATTTSTTPSRVPNPHPAILAIARLLGRQAAREAVRACPEQEVQL